MNLGLIAGGWHTLLTSHVCNFTLAICAAHRSAMRSRVLGLSSTSLTTREVSNPCSRCCSFDPNRSTFGPYCLHPMFNSTPNFNRPLDLSKPRHWFHV